MTTYIFLQCPPNCSPITLPVSFSLTDGMQHTPHPTQQSTRIDWWVNMSCQVTGTVLYPKLMSFLVRICSFSSTLKFCIHIKIVRTPCSHLTSQLKLSNGFQSYRHSCISLISLGSQAKNSTSQV